MHKNSCKNYATFCALFLLTKLLVAQYHKAIKKNSAHETQRQRQTEAQRSEICSISQLIRRAATDSNSKTLHIVTRKPITLSDRLRGEYIDNPITDLLLAHLVYPMKQRRVHFSNLFPWFIPKTGGGNQREQLVMQYRRFQHFDSTAAVNHTADGGRWTTNHWIKC